MKDAIVFNICDFRTNPEDVAVDIMRQLENFIGDTNSGVVRMDLRKGGATELCPE